MTAKIKMKTLKLSNKDTNWIEIIIQVFPQKTATKEDNVPLLCALCFHANMSKASVEPLQRRPAHSKWPVTATQTETEHAKQRQWPRKPNGAVLTSEKEFSSTEL